MSDETPKASSATAPGALKRCWRALRKPSVKYSFIGIASLFFVLGIIFWGGFNTGLEATNTLEFCISCHEMRDNVYQEYKTTIHFKNPAGVRAVCSDCHVPKDCAWLASTMISMSSPTALRTASTRLTSSFKVR